MVDTGIDGHHAVENTGLLVGVKLDQNFWGVMGHEIPILVAGKISHL